MSDTPSPDSADCLPDELTLTTQTRLRLSEPECAVLDAMGVQYGVWLRKLYAYVASHGGGRVMQYKTAFCAKHTMSSRTFNALRINVQGSIDSVTELLKENLKELKSKEAALRRRLKRLDAKFEALAAGRLEAPAATRQRWMASKDKLWQKHQKVLRRIEQTKARLKAPVPGIGFGTRKRFSQQNELEANGYKDHAAWRAAWRASRSNQVFFIGSSDETGGNQQCTLLAQADGTFSLRVRRFEVKAPKDAKYLWAHGLRFAHQEAALRGALARGQALSWRLVRDERGWRAMVSFARPSAACVTTEVRYGALGMDFNADHLAVTEVDPYGNLRESWRFDFDAQREHSTGQRKSSLSDALSKVMALALEKKLPLVIEHLDFQQKKKQLSQMSAKQAWALSSLAYSQYLTLVTSKCARLGVALHRINPAYTSVAGRIKYAVKRGKSVHGAAAGVIARGGMGLQERVPRPGVHRIPGQGAVLELTIPVRKSVSSPPALTWAVVAQTVGSRLREEYLATRAERQKVRKAGAGEGCVHAQNPLVEITVRSTTIPLIFDEQI